jgi:hypothetical protein
MKKLHQAHLLQPWMRLFFMMSLQMMMTYLLGLSFNPKDSDVKKHAQVKVSWVWVVQ